MTGPTRSWFASSVTPDERADIEPLLRGDLPEGGEVVSSRILRRVVRLELGSGRVVFGKQHLFPFVRVRLRYALRRAPADRERLALEAAFRRGLSVPSSLAVRTRRGFLGPRLSVLVTESLPEGRRADLAEASGAVEQLIRAGVHHPDLHPDNLRMVAGEPHFLDFQSVRFRRAEASESRIQADRIGMLAKFASGLDRDPAGRIVPEPGSVFASERERALFESALAAVDAARLAARRRHRLRSSTAVVRERMGLWGARLRLRAVPARVLDPRRFGEESAEEHPQFGAGRVAEYPGGEIVRFRASRGLREHWATADPSDGFLAWERTAPWPWATQVLYIQRHGQSGGGDAGAPADCEAKGRAD